MMQVWSLNFVGCPCATLNYQLSPACLDCANGLSGTRAAGPLTDMQLTAGQKHRIDSLSWLAHSFSTPIWHGRSRQADADRRSTIPPRSVPRGSVRCTTWVLSRHRPPERG
jgi:hypothetical protein